MILSNFLTFLHRTTNRRLSADTGGLHRALAQSVISGGGHVVRAFDWDQAACRVYAANHGPDVVQKVARSISLPVGPFPILRLSPSLKQWRFAKVRDAVRARRGLGWMGTHFGGRPSPCMLYTLTTLP